MTALRGCPIAASVFELCFLPALLTFAGVSLTSAGQRTAWEACPQALTLRREVRCLTSVCSSIDERPPLWRFSVEGTRSCQGVTGTWYLTLEVLLGPSFLLPSGHVVNLLNLQYGTLETLNATLNLKEGNRGNQSARSYFDLSLGEFWLLIPVLVTGPTGAARCDLIVRGWIDGNRLTWQEFELVEWVGSQGGCRELNSCTHH